MGLLWLSPPGMSPLSGEHSRKPAQIFHLKIKTDAVGMTIFADKGMEIPVIRKVIENISHCFCLDASEHKLTPIMSFASEVRDR
jgi:hypothetical protein